LAAPPEAPRGGIGAAVAGATQRARRSLLRNHGGGHAPVSNLELFFDLVFVFAITQISGFFHHHLDWMGLAESAVLFLAVWWVWMYTTWVTNWLNPDRLPVRVMLIVLMLASLVMAAFLPSAFAEHGWVFALCYAGMQIGRSAWVAWFFLRERIESARNMMRITLWFIASAPLWLAGALDDSQTRLLLWGAALAIDYAGPIALYRIPGLGQSRFSDWNISGSHMAERSSLFIIIALGEGIVVTGSTFAGLPPSASAISGFLAAFLSSVLMWWLYFDLGADRGARMISGHVHVGRIARNAYTYLHMPIVLGVVIAAVGYALVMEQAAGPASHTLIAVQTGGAALFLIGLGLFKRFSSALGNFPMSHAIALAGYLGLAAWAWLHPIAANGLAHGGVAILALACLWEWVSYHGGWIERIEALGLPMPRAVHERAARRRAAAEARWG